MTYRARLTILLRIPRRQVRVFFGVGGDGVAIGVYHICRNLHLERREVSCGADIHRADYGIVLFFGY